MSKVESKYKNIKTTKEINSKADEELGSRQEPGLVRLHVPDENEIGHLINISVGHTQRPIDAEMLMWALHLKEAGFTDPNRAPSPMRHHTHSVS